jgi:hypothetical protein
VSGVGVQYLDFRYQHPAKEEPEWKGKVERWYQLDPFAYGLAQAYWTWRPRLSRPPGWIWLASPGASNETDLSFARSGAQSPAKFVHTLPSVRCSSLCQVMDWAGSVFCVQKDPYTQSHALREAVALFEQGFREPIWVLSGGRVGDSFQARAFVFDATLAASSPLKIERTCHNSALQTDQALQEWLDSKLPAFPLPGGYQLIRLP